MSNSVSGKKSSVSTVKKASSTKVSSRVNEPLQPAPIQSLENESLSVEYMDDYRNLMLNYDPAKNKSAPEMTKYELALVIGKRATQIAQGAIPLFDVPARMTHVDEIAEEELRQKKTPFIIRRDLGNGKYEYWKIKDMKLP
jgi:DNA-directed RNA polymerase subunit K/omega